MDGLSPPRSSHEIVTAVLPLLGLGASAVVAVTLGLATAILLLAATALLVAIWQLWSSLQRADDDERDARAVQTDVTDVAVEDEQKAFVLRMLEDVEFERTVGKIDEDEYRALRGKLLAQAREALRSADARLQPFLDRAEQLAGSQTERPSERPPLQIPPEPPAIHRSSPFPTQCPQCDADNELDARFCKRCGADFARSASSPEAKEEP